MKTDKHREFRSDTMTLPTTAMRQAMAGAEVGDDVCNEDPTIHKIEALGAELLGKEAALFVASGVMGNQCALAVHGRPGDEVVLPESCHVVEHENATVASLWGLMTRTVTPTRKTYLLPEDIEPRLRRGDDLHEPRTGLIVLENALSDGTVMPVEVMGQIKTLAHEYEVKIHLDGARLFNAALALGVEPAAIAAQADSVMVCLSKGLGAPVGSLLVGDERFIATARRRRKMLGGGMRQVGVLAAPGILALTQGRAGLAADHAHARLLAQGLARLPGVVLDLDKVQTNMVWIHLDRPGKSCDELVVFLAQRGLHTYPPMHGAVRFVTSSRIDEFDVAVLIEAVAEYLG